MLWLIESQLTNGEKPEDSKMTCYTNIQTQTDIPNCLSSSDKTTKTRLTRFVEKFKRWNENIESRKQLANLNERLLKDAGITRAEADREIAKSFWQD